MVAGELATGVPASGRELLAVSIVIGTGPCAAPSRDSVTVRVAGSQDSTSVFPPNRATDRVPSLLQSQLPGVCGASRQSPACGFGGGTGAGVGACAGGGGGGIAVHDANSTALASARNFNEW